MDTQLREKAIYNGFAVHLLFPKEKPNFGDVFLIRGFAHPQFPPTNRFNFAALEHLDFDQVDDYFGIPNHDEGGDDVKIWLYPLLNGQGVYHDSGPFDGLALSFDALRNPPQNSQLFLQVISEFARYLPVQVIYTLRNQHVGNPPDLTSLNDDLSAIITHWRDQGIEPGSFEALTIKR